MSKIKTKGKFGTAPVFFTAISTILGAILFLRFGLAVGTLGFWGVIGIILLGHLVTIPTALAISEIATNKRVEGGGEYFIISRSFGLNIGAAIGMSLYLSQAISVAFYVIAFTEAFEFFFSWINFEYAINLPRQAISIPAMLLLSALIIKKGANSGVKALYIVVGILFIALVLFFLGDTEFSQYGGFSLANAEFRNADSFFIIFAIVFPAFTGMTAGVGLSGDLKDPSKSIPLGTTSGTIIGMILYFFIVYKLASSASVLELTEQQLIMGKIALAGSIVIPLGLAASTISSALGSIMVAPRTLQALAKDESFPTPRLNNFLKKERSKDKEPLNASIVTCVISMFFVILGDVNAVAEIISMFFMVTYGSLCLISFLNHFGSSPSYRPSFKSKWYFSLLGFITSAWVMFKINILYALGACALMIVTYLLINWYHRDRKGVESIFLNAIYQINRNLQIFLQKTRKTKINTEWRPSAICISKDSFKRDVAFKLLNWISYKYGFGTYLHRIEGYYSKATFEQSNIELDRLIKSSKNIGNHIFVDTIISPSYTSAIAQAIQIPGISGMENNMVIFEYEKNNSKKLDDIITNFSMARSGNMDFCILASSNLSINYKKDIHVWIRSLDEENANLMILLSFIISGHPDWKKAGIKIFVICKKENEKNTRQTMSELVSTGRLPITEKNIEILLEDENISSKEIINTKSAEAGLTLIGFRAEILKHEGGKYFDNYDSLGNILFVNANKEKSME